MTLRDKHNSFLTLLKENKGKIGFESNQFLIDEFYTMLLFDCHTTFCSNYLGKDIYSLYEYRDLKFHQLVGKEENIKRQLESVIEDFLNQGGYEDKEIHIEDHLGDLQEVVDFLT